MAKLVSVDHLNDYDLLDWFLEQEHPWKEEVYKLCTNDTLEDLVKFVRSNYQMIRKIKIENQ